MNRIATTSDLYRTALKCGVVALGLTLASCSASGTAISPPPNRSHIEQLKTPANPPVAVVYSMSFPMPETFDPNEYLPGIAMGPDQDMWISVYNSNQIARYNASGLVSAWAFPSDPQCLNPPTCSAGPTDMVPGPDGNMYVSMAQLNAIAQVTPLGAITIYPLDPNVFPILPQGEGPRGIAIGPDGNIWFDHSNSSKIGRMTLSGTVIDVYLPPSGGNGGRITSGPDHNMWFTEVSTSKVGRLNVQTGQITEFTTPTPGSYPHTIVAAADGNLWFTEKDASQVARITTSGTITEFQTPTKITGPTYMVSGSDGSLWFSEKFNTALCRVDPVQQTFVEYITPPGVQIEPDGLATGLNGSVWLTDILNDAVAIFTVNGGPLQRPHLQLRRRAPGRVAR